MQQVTIFRASRCTLTFREWMSKTFFSKNLWRIQNFFLFLPRQNITSGTDTADSISAVFVSKHIGNNTTAPCRVCGNASGSSACKTLTTRSAVSLCQKLQVMATTINATRTAQRAFSLKEWMNAKSNKKNKANICNFQNFFLSLPCQNFNRGTSAASSRWLFLYPLISVNDTAAPRRVCGNAPGSPAIETLTTRSAASLCQNSIVMATLTINRATRRTLTVKEWLSRKNECFSALCGEEFTNKHVLLAHLFCIGLIAACFVAEWLEGGAL